MDIPSGCSQLLSPATSHSHHIHSDLNLTSNSNYTELENIIFCTVSQCIFYVVSYVRKLLTFFFAQKEMV